MAETYAPRWKIDQYLSVRRVCRLRSVIMWLDPHKWSVTKIWTICDLCSWNTWNKCISTTLCLFIPVFHSLFCLGFSWWSSMVSAPSPCWSWPPLVLVWSHSTMYAGKNSLDYKGTYELWAVMWAHSRCCVTTYSQKSKHLKGCSKDVLDPQRSLFHGP